MDKKYSVEFFRNFVENLQDLCNRYLNYNQSVEVCGYVCLEIDNQQKERYVLSELMHVGGSTISESYCTKSFRATRSDNSRGRNVRNITNFTNMPSHLSRRMIVPDNQSLSQQVRPSKGTSQIFSQNSKRNQNTEGRSSSSNSFPVVTTKTWNEVSESTNMRSLPSNGERRNPSVSHLGKRTHSDSVDSDDSSDVIVVKQEAAHPNEEIHSEVPKKQPYESIRLPESIIKDQTTGSRTDEEEHNMLSLREDRTPVNSEVEPEQVHFDVPSTDSIWETSQNLGDISGSSSSAMDWLVIAKIRPAPTIEETSDGRKFTCQLCGFASLSELSFMKHTNYHPSCKECCIFVPTYHDLRSHMETEHGDKSMPKCKFCGKAFLTRGGRAEHERLKHEMTGRSFTCNVCGKMCVRKKHLEDHLANVHKINIQSQQS